jgi:hypothetical protein
MDRRKPVFIILKAMALRDAQTPPTDIASNRPGHAEMEQGIGDGQAPREQRAKGVSATIITIAAHLTTVSFI